MNIQDLLLKEAEAIRTIPIDMASYRNALYCIYINIHEESKGKLITSGIGKAGQVAHNLATTFCSTGTPAVFLHPTEALHGDLGIVTVDDVLLLFSNSGETDELLHLIKIIHNITSTIPIILITSKRDCLLAKYASIVLTMGETEEVCPLGLTPTTSTTVMSVIGDILVCMMMEKIGFTKEEYYKRHHGGYLGKKAKEEIK